MKKAAGSLLILLLVLFASYSVLAQETNTSNLEAKFEIIKKVYCEDFELGLFLRLTYKNIGNEDLFISKDVARMASYSISRLNADGSESKVEEGHPFISPGKLDVENFPDLKVFIKLQPEETLTIENVSFTTAFYESKYKVGLKEGKYLLKYTILTFPYLVDQKIFSSGRNKSVWTKNVTVPLTFEVDSQESQKREIQTRDSCRKLNDSPRVRYIISADGTKNVLN